MQKSPKKKQHHLYQQICFDMFTEKPTKTSKFIDGRSEIDLHHAASSSIAHNRWPAAPPPTELFGPEIIIATTSSETDSAAALTLLANVNQKSMNGLNENNDNNVLSNIEQQQQRSDSIDQHIIMSDIGIVGDLSCLKNGFHPAPDVANADIKYMR